MLQCSEQTLKLLYFLTEWIFSAKSLKEQESRLHVLWSSVTLETLKSFPIHIKNLYIILQKINRIQYKTFTEFLRKKYNIDVNDLNPLNRDNFFSQYKTSNDLFYEILQRKYKVKLKHLMNEFVEDFEYKLSEIRGRDISYMDLVKQKNTEENVSRQL